MNETDRQDLDQLSNTYAYIIFVALFTGLFSLGMVYILVNFF